MLSPDRFQRLMDVFAEVADLPEPEQSRRLADLGDAELEVRLRAMLDADRGGRSTAQPRTTSGPDPAGPGPGSEALAPGPAEQPELTAGAGARLLAMELHAEESSTSVPPLGPEGSLGRGRPHPGAGHGAPRRGAPEALPLLVGQYRMVRLIGEGGMGSVYEAEQAAPRRRVAIKVIRSSFASRRMLRRFAHEAHILGRLHHPGIAQIHEAGVDDVARTEQAFFVMELVEGPPLTTWAVERGLDLAGKLELIAKVGEAVAHAHQRGVIHRDLKPANILVDPMGQPKVLDFGVARVTDGDLELTTHLTSMGQLVGTLPYMSPEQVAGDPREIDVRSDVYALGVILHELVAGRLPLELTGLPIPEAARLIREREPQRLGTLVREARGDVETIAQKAMAKEKQRRYASAAEFVADVRRCLAHEPIIARQHSTLYVIRRQMRRYPAAVTAAALVAISLAVFSVHSWWQGAVQAELAAQAQSARQVAVDEAVRADEYATRLEQELAVSRIERGRLFGRADNIRAAEALLWPELLRDPTSSMAYHALLELYLRQPCIASWPTDGAPGHHSDSPLPPAVGGPLGVANVSSGVRSVACHPTLPRVACGLLNGEVLVIDADDGTTLARIGRFAEPVWAVEYLPSGALVVADQAGVVSMLEAESLDLLWSHRGHDSARALQAEPDGSFLSAGVDGTIVRWSAEGEVLDSTRLRASVLELARSPQGLVLAACTDGVARLRDEALEPVRDLTGAVSALSAAAFSPDGTIAYAGGADRVVRAWTVADGALCGSVRRPDGSIRSVLVTPDGRNLLTVGWWRLAVWSPDDLHVDRVCSLQESAAEMAFLADGQRVAIAQLEGVVRILAPLAGQARRQVGLGRGPSTLRLSLDGSMLAWGDEQGVAWLCDGRDGTQRLRLEGPAGRVGDFAFSPDGQLLAGATRDGQLFVWRCADGTLLSRCKGTNCASARSIAFSPDGSMLASCMRGGKFALLNPATLEPLVTVGASKEALSLAFAPDGRSFVTTSRDPAIRRWSLDGRLLREYEGRSTPWALAVSPDGRTLAVGNWAKVIDLFDLESGDLLGRLEGHAGLVHDVTFLDGRSDRALSTSADGSVRLWDVPARRTLLAVDAVPGWETMAVDRSPDGQVLYASTANGEILRWSLPELAEAVAGNLAYAVRNFADARDPTLRPLLEWAAAVLRGEQVDGPWVATSRPAAAPSAASAP